ncbi:Protein of unknown function DUF1628 [Halorhabdus utahensis DSM 12940]|uniref:Archaeal Type IV pilin N-terminal domain-containing protein n=1 Tax=Halorhabdus utahensis (strain DSM 12940 / JCM 11049 / AX-2) TaxID=519442 RepID=C7NU80_HALUD|nr:type IV pilin N-terminal domain-containing protein [Halorhabdus utahensis]ACV10977.1 Protein of unknown function DUF1628 [Halorhabdus utahensis DSM 12940]
MDPKGFLLDEDRGVSPVIGVILMVAITVILAAVIATFVMNMGPTETTMPNAQWNFDEDGSNNVIIEHNGGGEVDPSNIQIKHNSGTTDGTASNAFGSTEITAGAKTDPLTHGGNEVQIIWENPDSGETQIMADWEP